MLKRIGAENFKVFRSLDYKCAKLNVLMGLNGAGKSSFIQLLLTLRYLADKATTAHVVLPLRDVSVAGGFSDLKYRYAEKSDSVGIFVDFQTIDNDWKEDASELISPSIGRIHRIIRSNSIGGDDHAHFVNIEHPKYHLIKERYFKSVQRIAATKDRMVAVKSGTCEDRLIQQKETEKDRELAELNAECYESCKEYHGIWQGVSYVGAFRGKPGAIHKSVDLSEFTPSELMAGMHQNPNGKDRIEQLYRCGADLFLDDNSPMIFPETVPAASAHNFGNSLSYQVRAWLSVVSPGANVHIDSVHLSDEELLTMTVSFDDHDAYRYKPENVGFGISDVLPILVTVLGSSYGDILIIENPEAHLHPKGQAAIGNLIARSVAAGAQVFVETHSDHVVNGIRSAVKDGIVKPADVNIAFFERKEHDVPNEDGTSHQEIYSEVRNIRVDKNGSLSEYPDGFMDEWNNQLMELL